MGSGILRDQLRLNQSLATSLQNRRGLSHKRLKDPTTPGQRDPTSSPAFSPTRPTERRRAGRREPWERG